MSVNLNLYSQIPINIKFVGKRIFLIHIECWAYISGRTPYWIMMKKYIYYWRFFFLFASVYVWFIWGTEFKYSITCILFYQRIPCFASKAIWNVSPLFFKSGQPKNVVFLFAKIPSLLINIFHCLSTFVKSKG